MLTINLTIPENLYQLYGNAADQLNQHLGADRQKPMIDGKTLMAFALARYEAEDLCSQFDLALRLVRGEVGGEERNLPNPVLK
jgi:hypothetical protein